MLEPEDVDGDNRQELKDDQIALDVASEIAARQEQPLSIQSVNPTSRIYRHVERKTIHFGCPNLTGRLLCGKVNTAMLAGIWSDVSGLWPKCKDCFR